MANYQYRDPHFVIFALALLNTLRRMEREYMYRIEFTVERGSWEC